MEILHGLPEWFASLLEHWHGWLSGSILAFALELGEKIWDWKPPKKAFIWIVVCGLAWSCFATWRDEHHNSEVLMVEKANLWTQYGQCDKERAVKATLADSLAKTAANQQGLLNGQQGTFNQCVLSLAKESTPEPLDLEVMRWQVGETYHFANVPYEVEFFVLVATSNKPIMPTRGVLKCNAPFKVATSTLLTHSSALKADFEQLSANSAHVEFLYPPLSGKNPLVFFVYTPKGKGMDSCTFTRE
jgi:hypothetical protein